MILKKVACFGSGTATCHDYGKVFNTIGETLNSARTDLDIFLGRGSSTGRRQLKTGTVLEAHAGCVSRSLHLHYIAAQDEAAMKRRVTGAALLDGDGGMFVQRVVS